MTSFRHFTLAALLATSPALAGDDDLLRMVSESSDLAIHLTDTKTAKANWDKSPLKKVYESDEIKPRIEKGLEEIMSFEDIEDKEVAKALRESLTELYESVEGEILFSLKVSQIDDEFIEIFKGDRPGDEIVKTIFEQMGVLALAEVGDNGEKFKAAAKKALEAAQKADPDDDEKVTVLTKTINGAEVTTLNITKDKVSVDALSYGVVDKTAFLTVGAFDRKDLIANIKNGHKDPLAKSDFVADGPSDVQVFVDFTDLMASLKTVTTMALKETGMVAQLQVNLDAGWKALGLNGFRRMGMALDMSKPDLVFTSKVDLPTTGVLSFVTPKEPIKEPSIHAHKGVLSVTQANYDLPGLYDEMMKAIGAISPMGPMAVGMQLGQLEKQLGIKIREDLLGSLKPEFQYLQFKGDKGVEDIETFGAIIGLKDKAKFEAAIKTLIGAQGLEIEKEEFLDHTIHNIPMGGPQKLSYAFHDDQVVFGMASGGAVKGVIKQLKNPQETLWNSGLLDNHKDLLKPNPITLSLADFGTALQTMVETISDVSDSEDSIDFSKIKIPYGYSVSASWLKNGLGEGKAVLFAK